jgi:hypothetical protein
MVEVDAEHFGTGSRYLIESESRTPKTTFCTCKAMGSE